MSPVRHTSPRTLIIAVVTFAIGAVLVVGLFVFSAGKASESGKFEVKLGSDTFDAGNAEQRSQSIRSDGPFLFSDVGGGERDIYLQHDGGDPTKGWRAFDARKPGQGRECQLIWARDRRVFTDSCGGDAVAADGGELPSYKVEVSSGGHVIVDIYPDRARPTAPPSSPPTSGESTTSSIRITGSR